MDYTSLKDAATVQKTIESLKSRNITGELVQSGAEALERIQALIPKGASVYNGTSQTLTQIGYIEYLKSGAHGWDNLQAKVLAESDKSKQGPLRKQASITDHYLGSVHAAAETGELVIASNSGSQLPAIVFNASNIIFVVSTKKIVPTLDEGLKRLREHVLPLEDARMKSTGASGSRISKILLFEYEPPFLGRKVHVLFVNEDLGF